ncbi:hypothetical protein A2335_04130 [Candidatus Peregrinibacteria bacterium RIFOXYB2_FULL_32_7]|nr:MAG: hypothetical protein A2335_04130 [Candidatus Peregrinibacteria bacterium RIFOXYB2_FULL_32_7]
MNTEIKIVITGHIDHGKSTLIGRILYDTHSLSEEIQKQLEQLEKKERTVAFASLLDQLQEERAEEKTIDTTCTYFKTQQKSYVIIDAPGHKEYTKNMVTGASKADIAVIVIAANEGVKEQTQRHTFLLKLLGIKNVIVVITKMDLIAYSQRIYDFISAQFSDYLKRCDIQSLGFIPVSSVEGEGILYKSSKQLWYKGKTLLETFDLYELKNHEEKSLVFPVQDIYNVNQIDYLVGKVESGTIKKGQNVMVLPERKEIKVINIKKWKETLENASCGECIGLEFEKMVNIKRGDVITDEENKLKIKIEIKALIFWLDEIPLDKNITELTIEIATQSFVCRIDKIYRKINSSTLEELSIDPSVILFTEVAEVLIKMKEKIVFESFLNNSALGKFVLLRDDKIVAGGIIL